jgi:hypothetical protein
MIQELISPQSEPRAPLTKWVDAHERITSQFKSLTVRKDQKRAIARRRFWNENVGMYRQALAKVFGTIDFPTFSDKELRTLFAEGSMTSLISELFVTRFMDQGTKWTSNDLIDMFYLSCAAAYCDYVVGEVKTATHLQQIQRGLGKKVNVYSDLQSLVKALHQDGLTTDTERSNSNSEA